MPKGTASGKRTSIFAAAVPRLVASQRCSMPADQKILSTGHRQWGEFFRDGKYYRFTKGTVLVVARLARDACLAEDTAGQVVAGRSATPAG